jgi:predicted  nucleic acid-binding Zn-ribbon protein
VSNKSKEITDLKSENKSLKERNKSILMKMNEASSSATVLETKNTRLESQVENLISAFGHTKSAHIEAASKAPINNMEEVVNKSAICTRKDTCQVFHSKTVCSSYIKTGV